MPTINIHTLLFLKPLPSIFSAPLLSKLASQNFDSVLLVLTQETSGIKYETLKESFHLLHLALKLGTVDWELGTYLLNLKSFFKASLEHFLDTTNPQLSKVDEPNVIITELTNQLETLFKSEESNKKVGFLNPSSDYENEDYREILRNIEISLRSLNNKIDSKNERDEMVFKHFVEKIILLIVTKIVILSLSLICFYSDLSMENTLTGIFGNVISKNLLSSPKNISQSLIDLNNKLNVLEPVPVVSPKSPLSQRRLQHRSVIVPKLDEIAEENRASPSPKGTLNSPTGLSPRSGVPLQDCTQQPSSPKNPS